jgi:thiol:disulfide interchange protein DsbC
MVRDLVVVVGLLVGSGAAWHAEAGEAQARAALAALVPQAKIEALAPSAVAGFYEGVVDGQVLYVSSDGEHVFNGELWRVDGRRNLTETRKAGIRHDAVARVGAAKRIVFAATEPKHTVTVFTDFDCGYCRRLHQDIARYNELGISVEYLLYPRGGPDSPSFDKAVSVWCAVDRKAAFTAAKAGAEPEPKVCPNPVAESYALGARVGVRGTPTLVDEHGGLIGSYLPPEQLLARLQAGAP